MLFYEVNTEIEAPPLTLQRKFYVKTLADVEEISKISGVKITGFSITGIMTTEEVAAEISAEKKGLR